MSAASGDHDSLFYFATMWWEFLDTRASVRSSFADAFVHCDTLEFQT